MFGVIDFRLPYLGFSDLTILAWFKDAQRFNSQHVHRCFEFAVASLHKPKS
jgi:hypothetical protein